jgi:hypothetical protein
MTKEKKMSINQASARSVAEKLTKLHGDLSFAEQANLKLILGLSAGELVSNASASEVGRYAVTEALEMLCPYQVQDPRGVQYRGRPQFLSDDLLEALIQEAQEVGKTAIPFDEHYLGCGGPIADKIAVSEELADLVQSVVPGAESTGIASYIIYRDEGQGIIPHVDTDIFSLNVLLMLEHNVGMDIDQPSALQMHYADGQTERFDLSPGEIVIFLAGTQAHSRSAISSGENVTILTFGFMPQGAPIENYKR